MPRILILVATLLALFGVATSLFYYAQFSSMVREDAKVQQTLFQFYETLIDRNGYDEARKLATDLCDKGISQGDPVLEARGLVRLAYIEILFGKWGNKWKDKLERARKIMSDDQSIAKAELLMFSGSIKGNWLSKIKEGTDELLEAISLARTHRDDRVLLFSTAWAGQLLIYDHQQEEAMRMALTSVKAAEEVGSSKLFGHALRVLLNYSLVAGVDSNFVDAAYKLKKIAPEFDDVADLVLARNGESNDFIFELQHQLASSPEPQTPMEWANRARDLSTLASLYQATDQFAKAIEVAKEIPDSYLKANTEPAAMRATANLGVLYMQNDQPNEARECLKLLDQQVVEETLYAHEVIPVLQALGDTQRLARWAEKINEDRQHSLRDGIAVARQIVDSSWDSEIRSRQLEATALAKTRTARLRNYGTYTALVFFLLIGGIMAFRYHALKQAKKSLTKLVAERTKEIRDALEAAELATKSKREFLARANHEIRNPLQSIIGYSDLLRNDMFSSEKKDIFLRGILDSSEHLMNLVNDVIEVTKIENGVMQPTIRNFQVSNVVDNVVSILGDMAQKYSVVLSFDIEDCEFNSLYGDDTALRQILINLVSNGIKASENGKVSIIIKTQTAESGGIQMKATVSDNGRGIDPIYHNQIFEPFASLQSDSTGKGLGLHITQSLVKWLGGEIAFESAVGDGSVFVVKLPFEAAKDQQTNEARTLSKYDSMKVLVVDDKLAVRQLVQTQIEQLGHAACASEELEQTLDIIGEWQPDLVLLDLRMPGNSGFDFLRNIRGSLEYQPVVVAMTGDSTIEVKQAAFAAGFDGFLSKPFNSNQIQRILEQLNQETGSLKAQETPS